MEEVSCRALEVYFAAALARGVPAEALTEGLSRPHRHYLDAGNRLSWVEHCTIVERLARHYPDNAEWTEMGRQFIRTQSVKAISATARLFITPRQLARWMFKFGGGRVFNNFETTIEERDGSLVLELTLNPGYAVCPQYFWVCRGTFSAMPELLGSPAVPVDLEIHGNTGRFIQHFEAIESQSLLGEAWQAMRGWFAGRSSRKLLVAEFERNEILLEERYTALEKAKNQIEHQQEVLTLVHEVTMATHHALRLPDVCHIIINELARRRSLGAARLTVDVVQEGVPLKHVETHGNLAELERNAHHIVLEGRTQTVGKLEFSGDANLSIMKQVVAATVAAVENAISFEVISAFRDELETRVAKRTAELEQARDNLERSLESRNRFFANVNHELRSPLSVILLSLDKLALTMPLEGEAGSRLAAMQRNSERLLGLVDELLMLSAGSEAKAGVRLEQVELEPLAKGVVDALRPIAENKKLELAVLAQPLSVDGDRRQLERAMQNLVSNALKYTARGGVTVRVEEQRGQAVFSVQDTGEGIPADYVDRVFERFVQVPRAQARPGAGIGLALVKEIAHQHGGDVGVTSELGKGSTFTLTIPLVAGKALKEAAGRTDSAWGVVGRTGRTPLSPKVDNAPPLATAPSKTVRRVLNCEDNPDLRELIRSILTDAGYEVESAETAELALAAAEARPPDLLLTDLDLGDGMNGLQLCRAFRRLENHRNAPVLFLTASPSEVDQALAFEGGAIDYLTKPFRPDELLARIRSQMLLRETSLKLLTLERRAAQTGVLAGVAHELRNPLNGLVNAVGPLRDVLPASALTQGSAADELLGVIEECGRRVADLSHELLFFTRGDSEPIGFHPIESIAERALKLLRPKLAQVELAIDYAYKGPVRCGPAQLSQVVINLVENATLAAGKGGKITVRTRQTGNRAFLEVSDTGPGIPMQLRERIFEPFFSTRPAGQGTGLGLSISRDIARRFGAELEVSPEPPPGCTMRISLPIPTE